jgi:hypothetical protein
MHSLGAGSFTNPTVSSVSCSFCRNLHGFGGIKKTMVNAFPWGGVTHKPYSSVSCSFCSNLPGFGGIKKTMVNAFPWGGVIHKPYSSVSCSFCHNLHGFGGIKKTMVNAFPWGGVIHKPYSSVSCSFCNNLHGFGGIKKTMVNAFPWGGVIHKPHSSVSCSFCRNLHGFGGIRKKMVNAFPWGGVIHKPYSSVSCSFCRNLHGFGGTKSASHARPKIEPMPETVQIEPPRRHFVDFWSQGRKVLRSSLPGVILSTSGNNARKCSNRSSWASLCRLLEPRPESAQIEAPRRHFADFWSQGQKLLRSTLPGVILSTSGAKAGKCSDRASQASFCRLLEPRPESAQIDHPGRHFVESEIIFPWDHLGSFGVSWGHLGSSRVIWDHLGSSGALGSFWERLLQYL